MKLANILNESKCNLDKMTLLNNVSSLILSSKKSRARIIKDIQVSRHLRNDDYKLLKHEWRHYNNIITRAERVVKLISIDLGTANILYSNLEKEFKLGYRTPIP